MTKTNKSLLILIAMATVFAFAGWVGPEGQLPEGYANTDNSGYQSQDI